MNFFSFTDSFRRSGAQGRGPNLSIRGPYINPRRHAALALSESFELAWAVILAGAALERIGKRRQEKMRVLSKLRGFARSRLKRKAAYAASWLKQQGVLPVLASGDSAELPLKPREAENIYRLITTLKPRTVLEFGVGFSTLVIAHALSRLGQGHCYTVDCDPRWLENTRAKLAAANLSSYVTLHHSVARAHVIDGQLCTLYDVLPNVSPDFIYVDGPAPADVVGDVHGLKFLLDDGRNRQPISADPLLFEASSRFSILVDGRQENVAFLQRHLQGRYRIRELPGQQTLFRQRDA
jgi:hypothetical protein